METAEASPSGRPGRRWIKVLAVAMLVLLSVAIAVLAASRSSEKTAGISASCQAARKQFVAMENETVKSAAAATAAIGHWDDIWSQWTAGRMSSAQQQAALKRLRADAQQNGAAFTRTKTAAAALGTAMRSCGGVPQGCVAEFEQYPVFIAHESRETKAIATLYTTALAQNVAWNSHVHGGASVATVNAATAAHDAAERTFSAAVDEHNRLMTAFEPKQSACHKVG